MRLIDADEYEKRIKPYDTEDSMDKALYNFAHYHLITTPSEQSERKQGKWKPHREKSREYIGTVLVNVEYDYWFCDNCGYRVEKGQPMYNFCPNCGADMRGEQDGE